MLEAATRPEDRHRGARAGWGVDEDGVAGDDGGGRAQRLGGGAGGPVRCPAASVVASMLRRAGFRVHTGPIVSTPRVARGKERRQLGETGAIAVDMESAWLARGCAGRPWAVVRVIVDTPERELHRPLATAVGGVRALRAPGGVAAVLAEWSAA